MKFLLWIVLYLAATSLCSDIGNALVVALIFFAILVIELVRWRLKP